MFGLKKIINLRPSAFFSSILDFKEYLLKEYGDMRVKLKDIPGTNYELGLRHLARGNLDDAIMRFKMVTKSKSLYF